MINSRTELDLEFCIIDNYFDLETRSIKQKSFVINSYYNTINQVEKNQVTKQINLQTTFKEVKNRFSASRPRCNDVLPF